MLNPWLTKAKIRRVESLLTFNYLGKKYRSVAQEMTALAYRHPDWHRTFSIWCTVNTKDEIESIEIREN